MTVGMAGMWILMSFLLSGAAGWAQLARDFPATRFSGKKWWFCTGKLGPVGYRSCLVVGSSREGLFVSNIMLFRIAHPPIFIPWSKIRPRFLKGILFDYVTFDLGPRGTRLQLFARLGKKILNEGGISLENFGSV